jgi:hypothetical protein
MVVPFWTAITTVYRILMTIAHNVAMKASEWMDLAVRSLIPMAMVSLILMMIAVNAAMKASG